MSLANAETQPFDQTGAEVFASRIMDVLSSGAVAVMISIGHRTGLSTRSPIFRRRPAQRLQMRPSSMNAMSGSGSR